MRKDVATKTKRRYVEKTYHLIQEKGIDSLTIRSIAKEVGCSYAVLYKHFESLDYLIMLASMKFLDEYYREMVTIQKAEKDYLMRDLALWRVFNKYAFRNPPVFLHLFWEHHDAIFEDAVEEYQKLFPFKRGSNDESFYGYIYAAVFEGRMEDREFILLRHAISQGRLSHESAIYLSTVNSCIVQGKLREHRFDYKNPGIPEAAAAECDRLLLETCNLVCTGKPLTLDK